MYQMLATDLDGTLFSSNATVSKKNQEAIRRATAAGIRVILCSGRAPAEGLAALGKSLGLDYPGNFYICCSGAMLVDAATLTLLDGNYLAKEDAASLIEIAADFIPELGHARIRLHTNRFIYVCEEERQPDTYGGRLPILPKLLPSDMREVEGDITKLLFLSDRENYAWDFYNRMQLRIPAGATGYAMPPALAEYVGAGATKGNAVRQLAKRLGIPMEEVVCVGDGLNDLSMIDGDGFGIAVRNAMEPVLQVADYVLEQSNNEDAIARILEKILAKTKF